MKKVIEGEYCVTDSHQGTFLSPLDGSKSVNMSDFVDELKSVNEYCIAKITYGDLFDDDGILGQTLEALDRDSLPVYRIRITIEAEEVSEEEAAKLWKKIPKYEGE